MYIVKEAMGEHGIIRFHGPFTTLKTADLYKKKVLLKGKNVDDPFLKLGVRYLKVPEWEKK